MVRNVALSYETDKKEIRVALQKKKQKKQW